MNLKTKFRTKRIFYHFSEYSSSPVSIFDSEVKHGFKQAENRMVNNLASIKAAVAVGSKQNNKAITLVGDMVTRIQKISKNELF